MPSTGEIIISDTVNVVIPIKYIRLANKKLIERQYLIELNNQKDSIIFNYENYVKEQKAIIDKRNKDILEYNRINNQLSKRLEKQTKTSLICGTVAGASILVIVLLSIGK